MTPHICINCAYFLPSPDREHGVCMRYPPNPAPLGQTIRPLALPTDWCGEFKEDDND